VAALCAVVGPAVIADAVGAAAPRHSAAPNYSLKTGRVPSSERVQKILHISNDTTVYPAPKNATAKTSQRAALYAIDDFSPVRVDGRTFYPSVLFGLVTNSVMQYACNLKGASSPIPPSETPSTVCPKGLFYQRTPMWVVIQKGACTPIIGGGATIGGPTRDGTTTTIPVTTTTFDPAKCVLYTFVSATTGKYLYGEG
jgi:hypothetical protein